MMALISDRFMLYFAPDGGHNFQHNRNQYMYVLFATFATAIGGFLFGYDTAVINGANTYLKSHFFLSPGQEGLARSSAILCCIPGAIFAGSLSDRFRRKKLLFFAALVQTLAGVRSLVRSHFW